MDHRAVDELQVLDVREAELAARAGRLEQLDDDVAAIRARAQEIADFFESFGAEDNRRRAEIATAESGVSDRQAALSAAQAEAAAARSEEERDQAARAIARAAEHLTVAELRFERARTNLKGLESEAGELEQSLPRLESRARAISGAETLPAPGSGPHELVAWASQARAALFVAAGQVSAERDRIGREAHELASMLLGEPTFGSTVAQALRRVEERGS